MIVVLGTAVIGEVEEAIRGIGHDPVVVMATENNATLKELAEQRLGQVVSTSIEDMLHNFSQSDAGGLSMDAYFTTCNNSGDTYTRT